jgi:hypothetical protein
LKSKKAFESTNNLLEKFRTLYDKMTLSIMTSSIMTLSIITSSTMTLSKTTFSTTTLKLSNKNVKLSTMTISITI